MSMYPWEIELKQMFAGAMVFYSSIDVFEEKAKGEWKK